MSLTTRSVFETGQISHSCTPPVYIEPVEMRPRGESNSQPQRPQRRALSIELRGHKRILLHFRVFNKHK